MCQPISQSVCPDVTIIHDVLGIIVQGPQIPLDFRHGPPRGPSPHSLLVTSGGHYWRPVQTCSLEDPYPTGTDIWWQHRNMYGLQAGGMHLTGMISCSANFCICTDSLISVLHVTLRHKGKKCSPSPTTYIVNQLHVINILEHCGSMFIMKLLNHCRF